MTASREMPRYKCHKEVWALKIASIEHKPNPDTSGRSAASSYSAVIVPAEEGYSPFDVDAAYVNKHNPQPGGYYVVYDDGYKSYSPAAPFESGYSAVLVDEQATKPSDSVAAGISVSPEAEAVYRRQAALDAALRAPGTYIHTDVIEAAKAFDKFLAGESKGA